MRRRRPARDLLEGGPRALLAGLLHRPAPPRLAAPAAVPDRLGGRPARRPDRIRDPPSVARPPLAHPHLLSAGDDAAPLGDDDPRVDPLGRDPDQDLEQRADRAPPPGTGKAADGDAARRAREPDQS